MFVLLFKLPYFYFLDSYKCFSPFFTVSVSVFASNRARQESELDQWSQSFMPFLFKFLMSIHSCFLDFNTDVTDSPYVSSSSLLYTFLSYWRSLLFFSNIYSASILARSWISSDTCAVCKISASYHWLVYSWDGTNTMLATKYGNAVGQAI